MNIYHISILHLGFFHLINNTIAILLFGSYLEIKYKWWRILIIYILSSIGADTKKSHNSKRILSI